MTAFAIIARQQLLASHTAARSRDVYQVRLNTFSRPVQGLRLHLQRFGAIRCGATRAPATEAERLNNERRRMESGGCRDESKQWEWSLNSDMINSRITVGSCPRSAGDVAAIRDEAGCDAIVCLQCNDCLSALQVDINTIRQAAAQRGMLHVQVAIRDFDEADQAHMLPEAINAVAQLVRMGKRVYIHCTAGINRAPLTAWGYLAFAEGMPVEEARRFVCNQRRQANPYAKSFRSMCQNQLGPVQDKVKQLAKDKYLRRQASGHCDDSQDQSGKDWETAEHQVLQEIFQRRLAAAGSFTDSVQAAEAVTSARSQEVIEKLEQQVAELELKLKNVKVELATMDEQHQLNQSSGDDDDVHSAHLTGSGLHSFTLNMAGDGEENSVGDWSTNAAGVQSFRVEASGEGHEEDLEDFGAAPLELKDQQDLILVYAIKQAEVRKCFGSLEAGCKSCNPDDRFCGPLCVYAHPIFKSSEEYVC